MDTLFSLPSSYRLASSRSWGRTQGLTITPTGAAYGRREFLCFRPGFYLSLGTVTHTGLSREVYASGDFIKLHFRLEGQSHVGQPGQAVAQAVPAMSVSTLLQPLGTAKEEIFVSDVRERSVTLCCSRQFLGEELGLSGQTPIAGPFGAFMAGAPNRFELLRFPLHAQQHGIAQALLEERENDGLRGLYAEAKAFELLHGFLARDAAPAQPGGPVHAARQRLQPLADYIEAHLHEPLELGSLARRFGWSESRLARQFRQAYDCSLFDHVAQRRLTRAKTLLQAGELNVIQVALEVGYSHSANFSTAFKRHFGVSPRTVRSQAGAA